MKLVRLVAVFAALSMGAIAGAETLNREDNGRTVNMKLRDELAVLLPGEASAGYVWAITKITGNSVKAGAVQYVQPPTGPGRQGEGTFIVPLGAVRTGRSEVFLEYGRASHRGLPAESFSVTIDVTAAGVARAMLKP